jgi:hypothetical protein
MFTTKCPSVKVLTVVALTATTHPDARVAEPIACPESLDTLHLVGPRGRAGIAKINTLWDFCRPWLRDLRLYLHFPVHDLLDGIDALASDLRSLTIYGAFRTSYRLENLPRDLPKLENLESDLPTSLFANTYHSLEICKFQFTPAAFAAISDSLEKSFHSACRDSELLDALLDKRLPKLKIINVDMYSGAMGVRTPGLLEGIVSRSLLKTACEATRVQLVVLPCRA